MRIASSPRQLAQVLVPTTLLVIIFLWITPHHEPWFDEAQAWLLARDSSLLDLLANRLRYEGHPCLWYLLLRVPIGLGMPYSGLGYVSAALSVFGGILFWQRAPLPLLFRLLFPFSFFLFYQYGVVARSYSLLPLLTFALCILYPERFKRPLAYTFCLVLMAQVSVHSALVAGCWWVLNLIEGNFPWSSFLVKRQTPQVQAAIMFVAGGLFLIYQLKPPVDIVRPDFFDKEAALFFRLIYIMWNGPFTELWPVSLAIFGVSLYWFYLRGVFLFYLLPTSVLLLFFGLLYGKVWHEGVIFLIWLATVWVSFLPSGEPRLEPPTQKRARRLMTTAIAVLLGFHLHWSWASFRYDLANPYSGAKEIAGYLKENQLEKSSIMATQFFSPAILPYFDQNIFLNFNAGKRPSFFWWSLHYNFNDSADYLLKTRPDLLIVASKFQSAATLKELTGYQRVKQFPGILFFKDRKIEDESFTLFRREDFFWKELPR